MKMFRFAALVTVVAFVAIIGGIVGYALAEDAGGEGAPKYAVHINFSETYTETDLAEAADILRTFDPDADMMILESFPPQGVAIIESDDEGVCDAIEAAFEGKTYVSSVSCEPYVRVGDDGDEPVSNDND